MKFTSKTDLFRLFKILVSSSLILWLFSSIELTRVAALLQDASVGWLGAAFCWVIVSVLVSAYKWQLICKASKLNIPIKILWQSYWAGLFFNNFLPSSIGGDALRIYWSGKYAGDMAGAASSVIVERILATIGLSLLALAAYPIARVGIPYLTLFFGLMAAVGAVLMLLILFPRLLELLQKALNKLPKVAEFLQNFSSHGQRLRREPVLLLKALIWSMLFQACVVQVNYSIFRALNISQVSLAEAAVLIPATSVAAMLPVGINGYGTREGAYVALFAYLGIDKAGAMTVSLLFALIVSVLSLWGGLIWLRKGRDIKGSGEHEKHNAGKGGRLLCRGI